MPEYLFYRFTLIVRIAVMFPQEFRRMMRTLLLIMYTYQWQYVLNENVTHVNNYIYTKNLIESRFL